jgi:dipeptidyl-peptidase 4
MKQFSILFLILLINLNLVAQEKVFSIDEAVVGQYRQFAPENLRSLTWRGESDLLTWIDKNELKQMSNKGTDKASLLSLTELNTYVKALNLDSFRFFPAVEWVNSQMLSFSYGGSRFLLSMTDKNLKQLPSYPENAAGMIQSVNGVIAYVDNSCIYLLDSAGNSLPVVSDGKYGLVYGESVHRNEFGINGGLFWSPKGTSLAFYRMDESMVSDYPLVDVTQRVANLKNIKYPMAGMESHQVSIGIYDLSKKKLQYLDIEGPKDQYLTSVSWSPDEKYIYVAVLNRDQNHLKLNRYDAASGKLVNTLFEETNPKYVEPEHSLIFLPNSNDEFLWQSERDGFNHLYVYNSSGKLVKQLTAGNWEVTDFLGFHPSGKHLFIETTRINPKERHVEKIDLKTGKYQQLSVHKGTNRLVFNQKMDKFICFTSSVDVPNLIETRDLQGKLIAEILRSKNPYSEYKMGEMSLFTIKAADGISDLECRLIKPVDFDPAKKYPAIVYVYGGPHAQLVNDTWLGGARLWEFYMAQKGYVMLTLDNRGSAHRGFEFESIIHRNIGVEEMKDQMLGLEYLKSISYVDMERVGVHGWSYGGFMTISLMTSYPEAFKAGVAGGPVIDWKYYEVMYGERYMDTPQSNPEGYAASSLVTKAQQLQGDLLIIHGGMDPVVVWQHSQEFLNAAIKARKQVDYFIYPNHEHNVGGWDRIHLMEKVTRYFEDNL